MFRKLPILILFVFLSLLLNAQIAVGKWRTHFPFNTIDFIEQSENRVFALSQGKLFSIDKRDKSIEFHSKLNGLSGNNVSKIAFDTQSKILVIIYHDGNIDFMTPHGIYNLPDYLNKQMSVDKTINHISLHNKTAYLAAKFGIIAVNTGKMEFKDTYYIGENGAEIEVLHTAVHNNRIFAVSAEAIYDADVNDSQLINYERWQKSNDYPGSGGFQSVHSFDDKLILLRGNKLYARNTSGEWRAVSESSSFNNVEVSNNFLIAHAGSISFIYNNNFERETIEVEGRIAYTLFDKLNNSFWLCGTADGLIEYNSKNKTADFYKPNGPATNIPYKLKFAGNKLFVLQGGRWEVQYFRPGIVMIFEENQWRFIDDESIKEATNGPVTDFVDIAINPEDNKHFFVSAYGNGVFEFRDEELYKWYNLDNSSIESIFPEASSRMLYMRMDGGVYDSKGNIWFSNTMTANILQVYKKDGSWHKLGNQKVSGLNTVGSVLIPSMHENQKWILSVREGGGLIVMDDNSTIDDSRDDRYVFHESLRYFSNDQIQTIAPASYHCIAEDKKGAIWVGTDEGPFVINNPSKAFDADFLVTRIIIPRNDGTGLGDFLLEDQEITAIAIDGANRKWIGTKETGVYLLSENGQETLRHFTAENSPLISNDILSIAINETTGEVFFGTSEGLISYQSDAAPGHISFTNVHAYPNPVRETYEGSITIAGLVDNTIVKITDTAGNLVFETQSNGSLATWNGRNKRGQRVSTGVYPVLCITPDGNESAYTKILIIN